MLYKLSATGVNIFYPTDCFFMTNIFLACNPKNRPLPELLAPAGDLERLRAALLYGADAVYLGGRDKLNLRAGAAGFSWEDLDEAVALAAARKARIYYCLNALPRQDGLDLARDSLLRLRDSGVAGIIVADPGLVDLAGELAPNLPIHLSTQANTCNARSAAFWAKAGVRRVNLARELSQEQIADLCAGLTGLAPDLEVEVFVHGAMCLAVSGQCLMSAWLNDRPGNLGQCTHPCRFLYRPRRVELEEELRPGQTTFELRPRNDEFCGLFSPEDLCLVQYLPWLAGQGVTALKIEGRMRTAGALGQIVNVYRTALDDLAHNEFRPEVYLRELALAAARPLSSGFFLPAGQRQCLARPPDKNDPAGRIVARLDGPAEGGGFHIAVRGLWDAQRPAQVLLPGLRVIDLPPGAYCLENQRGEKVSRLHPGLAGILHADMDAPPAGVAVRTL